MDQLTGEHHAERYGVPPPVSVGVRRTEMRIMSTGLIVALALEVITAFLGLAYLFGGVRTLGCPIDYVGGILMFPGGILGWLLVWGDNFSNTAAQRLGMIAISMATNLFAGFILGVGIAMVWRIGKKMRKSNQQVQPIAGKPGSG